MRVLRITPPSPAGAAAAYEVRERIGSGGMGEVYLAWDRRARRFVALKVLEGNDPERLARFRREARIAARLADPAIVEVYGSGVLGGRPYIAMEYVPGGNLAHARLDPLCLARLVREVARALGHAHARGVVHRDIKPENILVDARGRPRLTDFGLARDLSGCTGASLSVDGQITGTPWSMSPEQARGEAATALSDVYSLGATLYHALTGQRPLFGATLIDVLHAVIHEAPPPPRSIDPRVPRDLERIVLRCLRKDPAARYSSMGALMRALDDFIARAGEPRLAAWLRPLQRPLRRLGLWVHREPARRAAPLCLPEWDTRARS